MARRSGRTPRSERLVQSQRTPVGIHIAAGSVVVLAGVMLAATLPAAAGGWRLVPVASALVVIGMYTVDPVAVAAVAVLAYLLVIGFLVNRFGVLTWHGTADAWRLVSMVGSGGAGLLAGALRRWRRAPRLIVPPEWSVATTVPEGVDVDESELNERGGVPRWLT